MAENVSYIGYGHVIINAIITQSSGRHHHSMDSLVGRAKCEPFLSAQKGTADFYPVLLIDIFCRSVPLQ